MSDTRKTMYCGHCLRTSTFEPRGEYAHRGINYEKASGKTLSEKLHNLVHSDRIPKTLAEMAAPAKTSLIWKSLMSPSNTSLSSGQLRTAGAGWNRCILL